MSYKFNPFSGTLDIVSAGAITALTGDVSATGPGSAAATVNFVGGKTAADIASATAKVDSATSSNSASTIVFRDASGNFAANDITANLIGNISGTAVNITATSNNTLTTLYALSLPYSQITGA